MHPVQRIFGVEFSGHRSDSAVPFVNSIENLEDGAIGTAYQQGVKQAINLFKLGYPINTISENDLVEAFGCSMQSDFYYALQDGVFMNSVIVKRFIEDFIAGVSYAEHIQSQLRQSQALWRTVVRNLENYGLKEISFDFAPVKEQLMSFYPSNVLPFLIYPNRKGIDWTVEEPIERTVIEFNSSFFSLELGVLNKHGLPVFKYSVDNDDVVVTFNKQMLEEELHVKELARFIIDSINVQAAKLIEQAMYDQYRKDQVSKVMKELELKSTHNSGLFSIVENVYK